MFLGSLLYLYIVYAWYVSGATLGAWLNAAQFFAPFVAAFAVVSSITLFFVGLKMASGKAMGDKGVWLWKYIMAAGMSLLIVTAGGAWYWVAVLGFLLTFIGSLIAKM